MVEVVRWERVVVRRVERLHTRLQLALNERRWSWARLARVLGVNESAARKWAARAAVTEAVLGRVSAALGVGLDYWERPMALQARTHRSRAWEVLGAVSPAAGAASTGGAARRVSARARKTPG